jgi:hypothetical protein
MTHLSFSRRDSLGPTVRRTLGRATGCLLLSTLFVACAEGPSAPTAQREQRDRRAAATTPPDFVIFGGQSGSSMDWALSLGNPAAGLLFMITAMQQAPFRFPGFPSQAAIHTARTAGFPTDGASYGAVSAGNAALPGSGGPAGPCLANPVYDTLCDTGGLDIPFFVPGSATYIEFDLRYFATDYNGFEDPVQVFIVSGAVTSPPLFEATLSSEIGSKPNEGLQYSPLLRRVRLNVTAYRGRTIYIRVVASNQWDNILPSGALIDNFRVI